MKLNRCFVALCAILALTSCKLRIVVPEGGSVTTQSGAYSCAAGKICGINIVDFYFDQTFVATPAEGYAFKAWRRGDRRFCGNDPKPCHILTTVFTGDWIPAIQKFLDSSDEVFYLQPIFVPAGDIIPVNGKKWLQPDLFNGLTWDEINAVCPNPDGACKGLLAGRDMTGWTWASVDDVAELFNYYIGRRALFPGVGELLEVHSAWAPAFFNTGWRPSVRRGNEDWSDDRIRLYSLTRNIYGVETGKYVSVVGIENCLTTCPPFWSPENTDLVTSLSSDTTYPSYGAWFFREPKKDGSPASCSLYVPDTLFCDTVNYPLCTVTDAQVSQIAAGMSYDQVVGIFGCHGQLYILPGGPDGNGFAVYSWGDGYLLAFVYGPESGYSVPTLAGPYW